MLFRSKSVEVVVIGQSIDYGDNKSANSFTRLYTGLNSTPKLIRAPVTIPNAVKKFVTGSY